MSENPETIISNLQKQVDLMHTVLEAHRKWETLRAAKAEASERRMSAILAAAEGGVEPRKIAEALGVERQHIYQIVSDDRRGVRPVRRDPAA